MKNSKLCIVAMALILVSCEKNDIESILATRDSIVANPSKIFADWQIVSNWTHTDNHFQAEFIDQNISNDVLLNGLVLVYAKHQNLIKLISGQLNTDDWSYQVEENAIQIHVSTKDDVFFNEEQWISYFIIPQQQLKKLEENGVGKLQLFEMSYIEVMQLLKQQKYSIQKYFSNKMLLILYQYQ